MAINYINYNNTSVTSNTISVSKSLIEDSDVDVPPFLIASGSYWRIWNTGKIERYVFETWEHHNIYNSEEQIKHFLSLWKGRKKNCNYNFTCNEYYQSVQRYQYGAVKFHGLTKKPDLICECKTKLYWINGQLYCKKCNILHGLEIDDYIEDLG